MSLQRHDSVAHKAEPPAEESRERSVLYEPGNGSAAKLACGSPALAALVPNGKGRLS